MPTRTQTSWTGRVDWNVIATSRAETSTGPAPTITPTRYRVVTHPSVDRAGADLIVDHVIAHAAAVSRYLFGGQGQGPTRGGVRRAATR